MNRRQKAILVEVTIVILVTIVAVVAIFNLRDYFNRRAAMLAMTVLGNRIKSYRAEHGIAPSESWVKGQRETLPGKDRLGELYYRARWIDFESDPNEILLYTERKSRSIIFPEGYLVLRLKQVLLQNVGGNVNIEWMDKQKFETLLAQQQSIEEKWTTEDTKKVEK
jgi:type II secretory pathway pseudopilin PulG